MLRFQHFMTASALLFAGMPAHAGSLPERLVILELCIGEQSPERVEAVLTNPVESAHRLAWVKTVNSITSRGGARFDIHFKGGAGEDDAASVAQALDRSVAGRSAAILSRSVQLGQPLPDGLAFGHVVCGGARRR